MRAQGLGSAAWDLTSLITKEFSIRIEPSPFGERLPKKLILTGQLPLGI